MKLLDRYMLREYLDPLIYCVVTFLGLQIVIDLFYRLSKFIEAGTTTQQVVGYYLCYLAPRLEYVMPASLLFATLYTLWRMTRHGELTAMRASGLSLYRIVLPLLATGVVCSLLTAGVKEGIAPRAGLWAEEFAANGFREVKHRTYTDRAYFSDKGDRLWMIGEFDIKNPTVLKGVKVTQEREDGSLKRKTSAERAEWMDGHWWFFGVEAQDYNEDGHPKGRMAPVGGSELGVEMPDLTETPADFVSVIKDWEFLSSREMARYIARHPDLSKSAIARLKVDFHVRLATPWACFVVVLFGIPAGSRNARQSAIKGVLLGVGFFFIFYACTQVGVFLGKRQFLSPWMAAWFSNIVFLLGGIHMLGRMR
jgi:lipopolysaccharide export system permease protein